MASVYKHARGGWYVALQIPGARRVQIYLGKVNKAAAQTIAGRLDSLVATNNAGMDPGADVVAWLNTMAATKSTLLTRLEAVHLLRDWDRPKDTPKLQVWWDAYLSKRTDYKPGTIKGWRTAWKHVQPTLGDRRLDDVTVADAKQFARDLSMAVASSHGRKILDRVRMVFADAIDANVITQNPFEGVTLSAKTDKTKRAYIDQATAELVMDRFASTEGRAVFALARWCGLRIPHEPLALRLTDLDIEKNRLTIPKGTKTGHRTVPVPPIVMRELRDLMDMAPTNAVWMFRRARNSAATEWRRWLIDAITKAGVDQWRDLWVNLRRSCRTDMEDRFPSHVCDAWLGHSAKVAADYYLLVTNEHWDQATTAHSAPPRAQRRARRAASRMGLDGAPRESELQETPKE